jgi:hypothetical protein
LKLTLGRISRHCQIHYGLKEFRRLTIEKVIGRERFDSRYSAAKLR